MRLAAAFGNCWQSFDVKSSRPQERIDIAIERNPGALLERIGARSARIAVLSGAGFPPSGTWWKEAGRRRHALPRSPGTGVSRAHTPQGPIRLPAQLSPSHRAPTQPECADPV